MLDRTIASDPAARRAAKPRYLPHAGRPSPRTRREPGPRVHLLQRTVPWGARRHRHLRRRIVPRSRRGSLRRPSLHHEAGVNAWIREGLAQETRATGPNGNPFKVLTLTRKGVAEARKRAAERGIDPGQEIGFARTRPAEAAHDTAIYRACPPRTPTLARAGRGHPARAARRRAQERCRAPERVRACKRRSPGRGRRAAPGPPERSASPSTRRDACSTRMRRSSTPTPRGAPDASTSEVASGNYRERSVRAKAAAGFRMHANGPAAARLLRSLGVGDGADRSSLRGPADRDPAALEL